MWRWMLAEGVIKNMKQYDEITGSDSKAGISILKCKGSSRRAKHIELKIGGWGSDSFMDPQQGSRVPCSCRA